MAKTSPRAWQRMLSGRRLNLLDPSPLDIELSDIAHGLARVARWNGQTNGDYPYSVAQHSILVLALFDRTEASPTAAARMMALLHDAPEYVMGDIISPFKTAMGGNYHEVEERLQSAVHLRFTLPARTPAALKRQIKKADRAAAYFEATELAGFDRDEALKFFGEPTLPGFEVPDFERLLTPWPTGTAQSRFVTAFEEIGGI